MAERFSDDFKRFFVRGLAAGLPVFVTALLLIWFFTQVQKYVGRYLNAAVQWIVVQLACLFTHSEFCWTGNAEQWESVRAFWDTYHFGWVGFLLAFVAIYIFGRIVASIIGRGVWRIIERTFVRLPIFKLVYPHIRQVTDYLLSPQRKLEFSRVVAVEYPRKGCWSVGLVTGPGMRTVQQNLGANLLTVFIPSSPTPFTGYTITVRRHEVIDLPISIDDALRFTVSGGVIMPINQQLSRAEIQEATQGVFPAPVEADHKENQK